ncbi:phage head-tail connector protein [Streptomyces sp. NPDC002855]|uniref:phage head-tail connector protein n=1 Tax=Streptomyces sp. NPDC002855 TaxID=3154437 RepID=UPI00333326E6
MALGDNYATTAELKTRLGVTDANDDTLLGQALSAASVGINKFCRRQFNDAGSASARVYYPLHNRLVLVDDFHTTTGLVVKSDSSDSGTFDLTHASTDYQLEPLNGMQDGVPGWPYWKVRMVDSQTFYGGRRPSVEVTARWGWAAVPPPIKEATLALAEEVFKMKDSPYGIAGFGDFVVRIRDNPKIAGMLTSYRLEAVRVA